MSMRRAGLSDSELEVLKVLWEHGPATVREVNDLLGRKGRRWAYTTVQTLLARLQGKGCVSSDKRELAHVYHAAISREEFLRERLDHLAEEVCDGASTPLVRALVEKGALGADDVAHVRALLDELESSAPRPARTRGKRSPRDA
jgi:predicted transcriptional regulator